MRAIYVENFESEPFMTAFKTYFGEISGRERNWPMLFRQMNGEKEKTKAILLRDGDTAVGFVLFCPFSSPVRSLPKRTAISASFGWLRSTAAGATEGGFWP